MAVNYVHFSAQFPLNDVGKRIYLSNSGSLILLSQGVCHSVKGLNVIVNIMINSGLNVTSKFISLICHFGR